MSLLLKNLKKYLTSTSPEQKRLDWEEVKNNCLDINSPTITEFIKNNMGKIFKIYESGTYNLTEEPVDYEIVLSKQPLKVGDKFLLTHCGVNTIEVVHNEETLKRINESNFINNCHKIISIKKCS